MNQQLSLRIILFLFSCLSLSACFLMQPEHPFDAQQQISRFAEDRYSIAMNYMTQGRYELASQQFAVAAESATSLELKELANDGQRKAKQIIINQR